MASKFLAHEVKSMPTHLVNLDALITREDFQALPDSRAVAGSGTPQFTLSG
jgi:hypothetical protein